MNDWIRFNQGNCPICNGARKDCRQNTETNLVHCRSTDANPSDWIFRGEDTCGFGMWANTSDAEAWTEERREEWKREQETKKQKRKHQEEKQNKQSLPAPERDQEIKKILSQLTLNDYHRQKLRARGFTNEQIELGNYRSVEKWQSLGIPVNDRLAGVKAGGRSLVIAISGIIGPIPNEQRQLVTWQLRRDDDLSNKYIWAASECKRENRSSSKTREFGELPLGIWQQPNQEDSNTSVIGLTEGTNIKPHLTSCRLNIPIIGASGGNFASSPKTLKAALEKLKPSSIILYPDAGAVCNPNIARQYQKLFDLLQDWGYKPLVAWWGQIQKSDGDIDEIDSDTLSQIEYLSTDEYLKLCKEHCKAVEIDKQKKRQEAAKNQTWEQLTSLTTKPWLEVNTPNIESIGPENKLERGHIYLLKSAKATGKTKTVIPLVNNFKNIYSWFNRIALGREECTKLGLDYNDDLKSFQGFIKAGFCANSAYQFNPSSLRNNGLLLVDESDQLLSYLFESICNNNGIRPAILKAFEAHLKAAIAGNGMALFMSADNSDIEYQFLKQIAPPGCEVRVIVNHYQPPKGRVDFDVSDTPNGSIDKLINNLKNGVPCFVIDDIKNGVKGCKSIAEYIRTILPDIADSIVEINSDTSGTEKIKSYLKKINEISKGTLILICSPSVISGISIENGHFQQGYGFFNGILTTKEASQSLVRVRGLENLTVWAANKGFTWAGDHSLTPKEIRDHLQRNYRSNSKYLSSFDVEYNPLTDEWNSPWFELYSKYAAYRNLSMSDLRLRLRQKLEEEGYSITDVNFEAQEDTKQRLKESWGSLNLDRAIAIESANLLTDEELEQLSNSKKVPTPEQQLDIEKTLLLKKYGQSLIDSVTHKDKSTGLILPSYAALYFKDDGGKWYRKLMQLYYLIDNHDEAVKNDRRQESRQEFHGKRFAGDISWNERKRKCRKHLEIDKLINADWKKSKDYQQLASKAKKHHRQVKDSIGLSVKKLTNPQIFTELISQLGLKTESKQVKQQSSEGKEKSIRLKRITPASLKLAQLFINHREELRLQRTTKKDELNKPEKMVTPPLLLLSKEQRGVLPDESYIQYDLEPHFTTQNLTEQKLTKVSSSNTVNRQLNIQQNTTNNSLDTSKEIVLLEKEVKTEIKEQNSKDIYNTSDEYIGQKQTNNRFDVEHYPQDNQLIMDNSNTEIHNTNQIQNPFDTEEEIAELADMLTQIENAEGLDELKLVPYWSGKNHLLYLYCPPAYGPEN